MKILLDTQMLVWAAINKLPREAVRYVEDTANTLIFSPASIWEVVIKRGLGRTDFTVDPNLLYSGLLGAGYQELPISGRHTLFVSTLPQLHKDPFDRILLAQAAYEVLPLLTSDRMLAQYPAPVILASV